MSATAVRYEATLAPIALPELTNLRNTYTADTAHHSNLFLAVLGDVIAHKEAYAAGTPPLVTAEDMAILRDMSVAELAEELRGHDAVSRGTAADTAYRAAIVALQPAPAEAPPSALHVEARWAADLSKLLDGQPSKFLTVLAGLPGSLSAECDRAHWYSVARTSGPSLYFGQDRADAVAALASVTVDGEAAGDVEATHVKVNGDRSPWCAHESRSVTAQALASAPATV